MRTFVIKTDDKVHCQVSNTTDAATILIEGELSWWNNSATVFRSKMEELKASGIKNVTVELNCPGGSVFDAQDIYNELMAFEGKRTVKVGAICASAATIILMAFPIEHRTGAMNGQYMIHNPVATVMDGEAKDMHSSATLLENVKDTLLDVYEKSLTLSRKKISDKMDATWWLTAKKAKEYGFIGHVNEGAWELPKDTAEVFGKYQYANIPNILNITASEPLVPVTNQNQNQKPIHMKTLVLALVASIPLLKNKLSEEDNEKQVVAQVTAHIEDLNAQVTALTQERDGAQTQASELAQRLKNHEKAMITAVLDVAEKEQKKITSAQRKAFEDQAEKIGIEGLRDLLSTIPARKSIQNMIEDGNQSGSSDGSSGEGNTPKPTNMSQRMYLRMATVINETHNQS